MTTATIPQAVGRRDGPDRAAAAEPRRALGHLLAHVGDIEPRHLAADGSEDRHRAVGIVGVDVDLQRRLVADDQHGVADLLESGDEIVALQPRAGDGEVRAVAELARLVLRQMEVADGRDLVRQRGRILAAQRGDEAGDDHRQAIRAGVDDAGLAQDRELLGPAGDGLLAGLESALEDVGQHRVLLRRVDVGIQPRRRHVRDVAGQPVRHRADGGQHRPLGGVADRLVGGVGGAREGGAHEDRIDRLTRPRSELLGRSADDLRQDHAGVTARAEQRRAGDHADELVAPDVVELLTVHRVQSVQHGTHGHSHVVAGIAVCDRENVQVVDLLAPALELGAGGRDSPSKTDEAGIGHGTVLAAAVNCRHKHSRVTGHG